VILLLLPKEIRHFGGIQYPLLASGLAAAASRWVGRARSPATLAWVGVAAVLPWTVLAVWIATIYLPFATGRISSQEFLRRYAGLQSDYEQLDKLLPADAKLLVGRSQSDSTQYAWYARAPIYYAPRSVLFRTSDVHEQDDVYLMFVGVDAEGTHGRIPFDPRLPPGYVLGQTIYSNAAARFYPSRTPGGTAGTARLEVVSLLRTAKVAQQAP